MTILPFSGFEEKRSPNSCCLGFTVSDGAMPPVWVAWNWGLPLVSNCLLGLRAGRWMGLTAMLLWGAIPAPEDILRWRLLARFPKVGLGVLAQDEGPGGPEWALMGGICWPLSNPGPCGVLAVRWRLMPHDLPFIVKALRPRRSRSNGTTDSFRATQVIYPWDRR